MNEILCIQKKNEILCIQSYYTSMYIILRQMREVTTLLVIEPGKKKNLNGKNKKIHAKHRVQMLVAVVVRFSTTKVLSCWWP
jgi:hypothetical protein